MVAPCFSATSSSMPSSTIPKLISGNANRTLAEAIAKRISFHRGETVQLIDARVERFNDGEIFVEVYQNVRSEDMFILQSTSNPANDNLMEIPVDNLYASPVFALDIKHHFKKQMKDVMIISPDVGGVARARELAQRLGADLAIVDKRRSGAGKVEAMTLIGDVKDRTCIVVDDIVDTAGTLCKAAETIMEHGASGMSVSSLFDDETLGPLYEGYYPGQ